MQFDDQVTIFILRTCACNAYSPGFKKIENIKATAPQRNVLKYFAIFKNGAHSLKPCETPSNSASHKAPNYVQRY